MATDQQTYSYAQLNPASWPGAATDLPAPGEGSFLDQQAALTQWLNRYHPALREALRGFVTSLLKVTGDPPALDQAAARWRDALVEVKEAVSAARSAPAKVTSWRGTAGQNAKTSLDRAGDRLNGEIAAGEEVIAALGQAGTALTGGRQAVAGLIGTFVSDAMSALVQQWNSWEAMRSVPENAAALAAVQANPLPRQVGVVRPFATGTAPKIDGELTKVGKELTGVAETLGKREIDGSGEFSSWLNRGISHMGYLTLPGSRYGMFYRITSRQFEQDGQIKYQNKWVLGGGRVYDLQAPAGTRLGNFLGSEQKAGFGYLGRGGSWSPGDPGWIAGGAAGAMPPYGLIGVDVGAEWRIGHSVYPEVWTHLYGGIPGTGVSTGGDFPFGAKTGMSAVYGWDLSKPYAEGSYSMSNPWGQVTAGNPGNLYAFGYVGHASVDDKPWGLLAPVSDFLNSGYPQEVRATTGLLYSGADYGFSSLRLNETMHLINSPVGSIVFRGDLGEYVTPELRSQFAADESYYRTQRAAAEDAARNYVLLGREGGAKTNEWIYRHLLPFTSPESDASYYLYLQELQRQRGGGAWAW